MELDKLKQMPISELVLRLRTLSYHIGAIDYKMEPSHNIWHDIDDIETEILCRFSDLNRKNNVVI